MVAASSLAKAMRVSLSVGHTGLLNLTQKIINCLMLLLLFLFVPSAYIMAWDSFAFSSRVRNWLWAALSWSNAGEVGGVGGGVGGDGCEGPG